VESEIFFANPTLLELEGFVDGLTLSGFFEVEVWRAGKCIGHEFFNATTNEGLNNMLGVTFHGDTQQSAWYLLLISNTSYSALAAADTMASHGGWTECIAYSESVRQQWTCGAAASKSITNSTAVTFTISVDGTVVKGIAVCSDSAKSGTTGKLWSAGLFSSDQTLLSGDQLKITYTVNIS
jgi:hypothetical protein